ncbi:MAG: cytochrome c oxidase subunit 3 [Acidimicrobiales bacterium]
MSVVPADLALGTPPPALPARPRVLLIGTAFAVSAMVLGFAGLFALYIQQRAGVLQAGGAWLPKGADIPTAPGSVAMVGLVMSGFTMQWAVWAIGHDDRPRTYMALGLTAAIGLAFINSMAFFLTQSGLNVHSLTGLLVFSLVGAHIAAVGAGIAFIGLMAFRTLGGQYSGKDTEGIAAAAIYWYAIIALYFGVWLLVFIEK